MSDEYPLYPKLTEEGKQQAQMILDAVKPQLLKVAEEVFDKFYFDVIPYIESDSWTNFRNDMIDGFKGYSNGVHKHPYDFAELRKAIYINNKEEIDKDLNKDLLKEIEDLKRTIKIMEEYQCRG